MLTSLVLILVLLLILYRHYARANQYWAKRCIPGPKPILLFGNILKYSSFYTPRSLVLKQWTQQYGKVYGLLEGQRRVLVVSDLNMLDEILNKKFECFSARARFPLQRSHETERTHIMEATGRHWKRIRAISSHAFTNNSLKKVRNRIDASAIECVERMKGIRGEFNIHEFFQEYAMHVICKIALGKKDVKMFENPFTSHCKNVFSKSLGNPVNLIPCLFPFSIVSDCMISTLEGLGKLLRHPFMQMIDDLEEIVMKRKQERNKAASSTFDFIDIFLDAESEMSFDEKDVNSVTDKKLTLQEIVRLCMIFVFAGFETTAHSLGYALHFIANHPNVQEKLFDEIHNVFPQNEIDLDNLGELVYMDAFIKEALRHYPVASIAVTRECVQATNICGYEMKEGDKMYTDTWSMHMDKDVWGEDAEEFRPERFLEEPARPRVAFQAFGEGPMMCLGMRLAYMEEKIILLRLLKTFKVNKTEHTNPLTCVGSLTVSPEKVVVQLERRIDM